MLYHRRGTNIPMENSQPTTSPPRKPTKKLSIRRENGDLTQNSYAGRVSGLWLLSAAVGALKIPPTIIYFREQAKQAGRQQPQSRAEKVHHTLTHHMMMLISEVHAKGTPPIHHDNTFV